MIYPLLRPVQSVFNSAAAIRNTLTLDFDGDVKEAGKPLFVKRPHTHTHTGEIIETQLHSHLNAFIKRILFCFIIIYFFLTRRQFVTSFLTPPPHPPTLYDYSLKELWITVVLSALSKLMVCRKLWKHRWREKEAERNSQRLSRIINLAIYPPV